MNDTSQVTEKLPVASLQEFSTAELLGADLTKMSDEELRALVRRFQQARTNPQETTRMKKTAEKKATGKHVDPLGGLV